MPHIHPFPARMAPEIALGQIRRLPEDSIILDPMCGSGMVLSQSAKQGVQAIGCDLDPLSRLMSKVSSTRVADEAKVFEAMQKLLSLCSKKIKCDVRLSWIDDDEETIEFIRRWFAFKQRRELRLLSYFLVEKPFIKNQKILDILKISVSRLIITKEPKASLARDTAHSRPHKTICKNNFSILREMEKSTKHVLRALESRQIKTNAKIYATDARKMTRIKNDTIDAVITSPPYLNAIDYMRGHKFSLVWFGHTIAELRKIRSTSIGAERVTLGNDCEEFDSLMRKLKLDSLDEKLYRVLKRYYSDLLSQLHESFRVLKPGGAASYVIGNSSAQGIPVENNKILKHCAVSCGFEYIRSRIREIPDNKRYLPVLVRKSNALSRRMKFEYILKFEKPLS